MNDNKRGVPPLFPNKFNSLLGHHIDAVGELQCISRDLTILVFATHYFHSETARNVITIFVPYITCETVDFAIFSSNTVSEVLELASRYHAFVDKDERCYEYSPIMQESTITIL